MVQKRICKMQNSACKFHLQSEIPSHLTVRRGRKPISRQPGMQITFTFTSGEMGQLVSAEPPGIKFVGRLESKVRKTSPGLNLSCGGDAVRLLIATMCSAECGEACAAVGNDCSFVQRAHGAFICASSALSKQSRAHMAARSALHVSEAHSVQTRPRNRQR